MRVQPVKMLLVLITLNLVIYTFSFAQVESANLVIEEKVDELWTTGKLKIG